jgi:menaquinone-9 beta-reductase
MLYDAIVVGSGPGGAVAASILAKQGKSVLLADRQAFPRNKICGDGMPANVMVLMRNLGMDINALGLEYQRIKSLSITGPGGKTLTTHEEYQDVFSMTARRYSFDNALHQHALRSGAKFEVMHVQEPLMDPSGEKAIGVIERRGKTTVEHEARVVIAADGASSAIARAMDARIATTETTAVAIRGYGKLKHEMPPCVYFYFNKSLLPGYAWIFPIANGYANIGVYLDSRSYRDGKHSLPELLAEFLESLPPEFELDLDSTTAQTWPLPLWTAPQPRTKKGVMFVGDAGAFVNAITGGGIYPAMMTGLYAAQHALDVLDGTERYPTYEVAWKPEIGKSLHTAHLIQRYVAPSALILNSILTVTGFSPFKQPILRALSGEHY